MRSPRASISSVKSRARSLSVAAISPGGAGTGRASNVRSSPAGTSSTGRKRAFATGSSGTTAVRK